jgi:hypothetical protein
MNSIMRYSVHFLTWALAGSVTAIAENPSLTLTASVTNVAYFREPLELQITLQNKRLDIVHFGTKSPYSDCRIEVYDSDGEPALISEFGRTRLAQDVFAEFRRPTQIDPDSPAILVRRRSWSIGWLGVPPEKFGPVAGYAAPDPRDYSTTVDMLGRGLFGLFLIHPEDDFRRQNPPTYTWTIDLEKCYDLQPGHYTVHVYYYYWKLNAKPVQFEIKKRMSPETPPGLQDGL